MTNPPCICDDIYESACRGEMDGATWTLEEDHRVLYGHCASCHHRSQEPQGVLSCPSVVCTPLSMQRAAGDDTAAANAVMARWWKEHNRVA